MLRTVIIPKKPVRDILLVASPKKTNPSGMVPRRLIAQQMSRVTTSMKDLKRERARAEEERVRAENDRDQAAMLASILKERIEAILSQPDMLRIVRSQAAMQYKREYRDRNITALDIQKWKAAYDALRELGISI